MDAAYHIVSTFAGILTPLLGGMAAVTAIVMFTVAVRLLLVPLSYRASRGMDTQARMAPQVQDLQKKHAGQPDALRREVAALYRAEGTTTFAGCLPCGPEWRRRTDRPALADAVQWERVRARWCFRRLSANAPRDTVNAQAQ